jgi:hypothetical protein
MRPAFWFVITMAVLCAVSAWARIRPAAEPPIAGTISGTVRVPDGQASLAGRQVEAVNVETGERQQALTNGAGGFSFNVKPGTYRLQVTLADREVVMNQPDLMRVSRRADVHADFVINRHEITHRRPITIQPDPALGPPIA